MPETWNEAYGWNARQNHERFQQRQAERADNDAQYREWRREREELKRRRAQEREELLNSMSPEERREFLRKEEAVKTRKAIWICVFCLIVFDSLMIWFGDGLKTNIHKGVVQIVVGCILGLSGLGFLVYAGSCADAGRVSDMSCGFCVCPVVLGVFGIFFLGGCVVENPNKHVVQHLSVTEKTQIAVHQREDGSSWPSTGVVAKEMWI